MNLVLVLSNLWELSWVCWVSESKEITFLLSSRFPVLLPCSVYRPMSFHIFDPLIPMS